MDDCVQEAMARVVAMPTVDLNTVGPLLSTVVANLAADVHRGAVRSSALKAKVGRVQTAVPAADDFVCDQDEARWLSEVAGRLPEQDRAVLFLRADGLSVSEVAAELGITYKAAEGAFSRARKALRTAWRATLGVIAILFGRPGRDNERAAVLCSVATAATLAFALAWGPGPSDAAGETPGTVSAPDRVAPVSVPVPAAAGPQPLELPRLQAEPDLGAPTAGDMPSSASVQPVPASATTSVVAAEGPVVGPADTGDTRVVYEDRGESLAESVEHCLNGGLVVSPFEISCD